MRIMVSALALAALVGGGIVDNIHAVSAYRLLEPREVFSAPR